MAHAAIAEDRPQTISEYLHDAGFNYRRSRDCSRLLGRSTLPRRDPDDHWRANKHDALNLTRLVMHDLFAAVMYAERDAQRFSAGFDDQRFIDLLNAHSAERLIASWMHRQLYGFHKT